MKSIFKEISIIVMAIIPFQDASACTIQNSMTDILMQKVAARGGFPVSDAHCTFLKRNHLDLAVDGNAVVLNGVNVGWAVVHLQNSQGVVSDLFGESTSVDTGVASQEVADAQFYKALTDAIYSLNWEIAAKQVTNRAN
ncbi:hypothetical protein [Burkholderia glumae]|uniref:hypothetical protein n=1 Tax=Burkholderia glumae TaxID=337 RepID=UPI002151419F|nr:hypothetical protein [Burkholderia glumae]